MQYPGAGAGAGWPHHHHAGSDPTPVPLSSSLKSGSGAGAGAVGGVGGSSSVSSPGVVDHMGDGLGGEGGPSGVVGGARDGGRGRVESRDHYVRSGSGENGSAGQGLNGSVGINRGQSSSTSGSSTTNVIPTTGKDGQERREQPPPPTQSSDGRPRPARVATSPTDASLTSSRSRRLVSGYRFGSGPEDSQSYGGEDREGKMRRDSESTVRRFSVVNASNNNNASFHSGTTGKEGVDGSAAARGKGKWEDEAGLDETDEERDPPAFPGGLQPIGISISSSSNPRRALSNTSTELMEDDHHDDLLSVSLSRASSPPSLRDGFVDDGTHPSYEDALNGVTDGEADADVRAMQATGGGSEGFMRGVEGEEGRYSFPTHRLRTRMKGESGRRDGCGRREV